MALNQALSILGGDRERGLTLPDPQYNGAIGCCVLEDIRLMLLGGYWAISVPVSLSRISGTSGDSHLLLDCGHGVCSQLARWLPAEKLGQW